MCGIAALLNFDKSYVNSIKQSLFHRGPDAQTHYHHNNLHLIHTRLSIQDIKNGDQPFKIGQYIIIFNGEIYNHLDLRKNLKKYVCKTQSDTETLLALFIEFGSTALEMIDGMFAFVIYDIKNNKLTLGRDRLGKKPIYLYKSDDQIFISSELNTLLDSIPNLSINEKSIATFLRVGFFSNDSTPYNYVETVMPGYTYEIDIPSLQISKFKYFSIVDQYSPPIKISHKDALFKLDSILHKSIRNRLMSSDLDVGVFLSGGIDSSLIVAIATQYKKNIKTFTVKFDGGFDESKIAALTSKKFGTNHHELKVSIDLKNDVEKILNTYGEPFMDSSAIPSYYISKEAKKYVTVVLNGDGADELFAGYRRYVPFVNNWIKYAKYISVLGSMIPNSKTKMSNYNYFSRLLNMANKDGLDQYLSSRTDIFEDIYRFGVDNIDSEVEKIIDEVNNENLSALSKCLILDSKLLFPSDLLKKMDIATMSHSLEGRSPFLSKYMLEWAPKLPDIEKIKGLDTKHILRSLAKSYSLDLVYKQPKRGFEVPLSRWVDNDLKENIYDRLKSSNSYSQNFVSQKLIKNLLDNPKIYSIEKRAKILWSLYSLEVWHNNYTNITNSKIKISNTYKNLKNLDNTKKTNILFLTTGLGLGGAERVVFDICKNINKSKFEVSVIGISSEKAMLKSFYEEKIHAYVLNYRKNISKFFNSLIQISRHIHTHKIQIIHAHMFHTLIIATLIKIYYKVNNYKEVKIIFTPHNSFYSMKLRRLILWALKPFRDMDTIFAKDSYSFFYKKRSTIIPNGIDVKQYQGLMRSQSKRPFTFIVIGRLEFMKNHEFLINQVSELNDYSFKLNIVGSGILEKTLKDQVNKLNLNNKVEFLGSRDDVPNLLNKSDCLLLPSLWESFPIVLLEAGASNVPVISTSVGSINSFVDNECGYIVGLNEFKDTMIEVLKNYENAMIKSTILHKKIILNYDIKNVVKKYESLYEEYSK